MKLFIRDTGITVVHEPGSGFPLVESVREAQSMDHS